MFPSNEAGTAGTKAPVLPQVGQLLGTKPSAVPWVPQQLEHAKLSTLAGSLRSQVNRRDPSRRVAEHSEAVKQDLKASETADTGMNWGMKLILTALNRRQAIKLRGKEETRNV